LAINYGAIDLIGPYNYRGLARKVISAMQSGELPLPHKALYISVDGDTVQRRNETRVPKLDNYWVNPDRIDRQNEFYHSLMGIEGIELVNGAREREDVLEDCVERSLKDSVISNNQDVVTAIEEFNDYFAKC
jgi:hypothetical protein